MNSGLFATAIVSGCCWEPDQDAFLGPQVARVYHQIGWPRLVEPADAFWRRISLIRNGSRFPLLFQSSDDEYLSGLGALTALQQRGTPVDMFVYPQERHNKFQPAHRLAIYQRNLEWLKYWLKDIPPTEPAWRPLLAQWDNYKREKAPLSPSEPPVAPASRDRQ